MRLTGVPLTVLAMLAVASLAACGSVAQPGAGDGWSLVRVEYPSSKHSGITVAPAGDNYGVEITVPGMGGSGCGVPTFVGFQRAGNILLGRIARSARGDACKPTSNITWAVVVTRAWIPPDVTQIAVDEPCADPGCIGLPIVIPAIAGSGS